MGITNFTYGVSLSTRIPFFNDLAKPHKEFFIRGNESLFCIPLSYSIHKGYSYCFMIVFIYQFKSEIRHILD